MDLQNQKKLLGGYYYLTQILDDERIVAITPMLKYYKVQDVIPLIRKFLLNIRYDEMMYCLFDAYHIKNHKTLFTDDFNKLCFADKLKIYIKTPDRFMKILENYKKMLISKILYKGLFSIVIDPNHITMKLESDVCKISHKIDY